MKIHFAAAALHVTVVNLNVNLAAAELEYILVNSECQMCFVDTGVGAALLEARKRILKEGKAANGLDVVWVHVDKSVKQPLEEEEFGYEFSRCVSYEGKTVALPDTQGSLDDAFHMYYTSGTTGKPKPVELSHRIVVYHAVGTIKGAWRIVFCNVL
jgi:long-subunit acyl-CoA synthetase (AMP-forming)